MIEAFVRHNKLRSRFNTRFDDFLSEKLQQNGVNCWLRSISNWFKKERSRKSLAPFWSGLFTCIDPFCTNIFKAQIQDNILKNYSIFYLRTNKNKKLNSIKIFCKLSNHSHNVPIKSKVRCSGKQRSDQEIEVLAKGVEKVSIENSLYNDECNSFLGINTCI